MKIHHEVKILNQKTRYTARVLDAKIHVTVPRIIWQNGTAHLVSRQELISDLPTVLRVYEHIDDRQPFDAWRLIGQHINDVYLQGVEIMDDREGFEKWASDDGAWPKAIERDGEGYRLMQTQLFWCGWKAACKFRDEPKV